MSHPLNPDAIAPVATARNTATDHARNRPVNPDAPADRGWAWFWFAPTDPFGLHAVRVATGLVLLVWLLTLAPDAEGLFSLNGWFDRQAYVEGSRRGVEIPKPFSWSLLYLFGGNPTAFRAFYWGSVGVLVLFTLGLFPRVTAVLTWLATLSLTASPAFDDEVEVLFRLLTLYLAVGYVLAGPWPGGSWAERILGSWRTFLFARREGEAAPSAGVTIALRLIQVHLAILLVTSALHKLQSSAWWSGVAHWYLLYPPLEVTPAQVQALTASGRSTMAMLNLAAYATLAWQLAFPMFAWRAGWWRAVLIGGAVAGWIGLATVYRMPLFGPAMLAATLAFLGPTEWRQVREWLGGLVTRLSAPRSKADARANRQVAVPVGGR